MGPDFKVVEGRNQLMRRLLEKAEKPLVERVLDRVKEFLNLKTDALTN